MQVNVNYTYNKSILDLKIIFNTSIKTLKYLALN